jgi:PAS domain S-box-containing protein
MHKWQKAVEQSAACMALIDVSSGNIHGANNAAASLMGCTAPELVGRSIWDTLAPGDLPQLAVELSQGSNAGEHVVFETVLRRFDGRQVPVRLDVTVPAEDAGTPSVAILHELHDAKRAEGAWRESARTLRALLDSAAQAFFAINHLGVIAMVNRTAGEMFGYRTEELLGQPVNILVPPESRKRALDQAGNFSSPSPLPIGFFSAVTGMRKNGTTFPIEVSPGLAGVMADARQASNGQSSGELAIAVVSDISERVRLERIAEDNVRTARALAAGLITAQDDERRRVSRELHDGVCQNLVALAMRIGDLMEVQDLPALRRELKTLQSRAARYAETTRDMAHRLHPSVLDDIGVVASLQSLCDEFSAQENITVTFTSHALAESLFVNLGSCFYRVAQQSLQNVIQHSHAAHAWVTLAHHAGTLTLSIEDDGVGFDLEEAKGRGSLGLISMRERALLAAGTLSINSRPAGGTTITLEVPVS